VIGWRWFIEPGRSWNRLAVLAYRALAAWDRRQYRRSLDQ
jgi:hypothetical protein